MRCFRRLSHLQKLYASWELRVCEWGLEGLYREKRSRIRPHMPFLTECQRRIYLILYDEDSISHQLISGIFKFSANTNIHLVKPVDSDDVLNDDTPIYPNAEIVESFCHKTGPSCKLLNWQYIPFMRNLQLSEDFLEKCKTSNIAGIDLLKKAYVHGLNEDEMKKFLSR